MKTPFFLFPSTVMTLDDDVVFSSALHEALEDDFYSLDSFTDVELFKNSFYRKNSKKIFFQDLSKEVGYETRSLTLSVNEVMKKYKEYFKQRPISCVVMDYELRCSSGLEVLRDVSLKTDFDIQRILLTGEADEKIAVEAFNSKQIDHFIPKTADSLISKVKNTIRESIFRFFVNLSLSSPLNGVLKNSSRKIYESDIFHQRFNEFLLKIRGIEYRLISLSGIFLVKNHIGEMYIYANINDDYDDLIKDNAQYLEHDSFVKSVLEGKKYPLNVKGERIFIESPENWEKAHEVEIFEDGSDIIKIVSFKL